MSDSHRLAHVPNSPPIGGACSVGDMLKGRSGFSRWYFFQGVSQADGPCSIPDTYQGLLRHAATWGNGICEKKKRCYGSVWLCPLHASCSSDSMLLVNREPLVVRSNAGVDVTARWRSAPKLPPDEGRILQMESEPAVSWSKQTKPRRAAGLVMRSSYPKRETRQIICSILSPGNNLSGPGQAGAKQLLHLPPAR